MKNPNIQLNNGVAMPAMGLGVYRSGPDETVVAVKAALATGYRLIDTAAAYGNEQQVGEAVRASDVDRGDVFITTKLFINNYGYEEALKNFDESDQKLGVGPVDLYLLHQPLPNDFEKTIAAYKAAEKLLVDGRVRAIGVSNFSEKHLADLMAQTEIVPAVNQIEVHPFFVQKELRAVHKRLGIVTQAWSPIGGVMRYYTDDPKPEDDPLTHPVITKLAEKHGKTPAQVILRWQLEHGHCAIPKSVKPHRIRENFDVFDFHLSAEEVASIDALDTGERGGPEPEEIDMEWLRARMAK